MVSISAAIFMWRKITLSSNRYDDNRYFSKQMLYSRFNETGRAGVRASLFPAFADYLQAYVDVVLNVSVFSTMMCFFFPLKTAAAAS